MPISEDFKQFAEKVIPNFKVTDETTEAEIETALGAAYLTNEEAEKKKFSFVVSHETKLKKLLGETAKGKTLEEMVSTVIPTILQEKDTKATELENELKSSGKTTEDYEKLKNKLTQVEADLKNANEVVIPELNLKVEELEKKPDLVLKEHLTKEKANKAYFENPNMVKDWDDDKKIGVFNRKIEGKVVPILEEDGELYAYEPDGETYMKDGVGKKKYSKFVEEVLKSDDVKGWIENGATSKQHPDNSKKVVVVDKAQAHKDKMNDLANQQKSK